MVFLSICTAIYDYVPQGDNELAISEGETIYILEKGTSDDWWKAKKRVPGEADEEPVGLIPNNYVEEARPTHHAKALYDYTRQTEEEISFSEDSALSVYDTSDPDWTLVGLDGEFGFVPANYIEISGEADHRSPVSVASPQLPPREVHVMHTSSTDTRAPSSSDPVAVLAEIMHGPTPATTSSATRSIDSQPSHTNSSTRRPQYTPEESDEEPPSPPAPSLPQRPASQQSSPPITQYASSRQSEAPGVTASPPYNRTAPQNFHGDPMRSPSGGFHLYNINEMVVALGKKKKLPTTLGLNVAKGNIMIAPEKSRDGPQQEWTAEKLTHYSMEGKHVFLELVRPSKSVDFHAGAKDTAQEIVSTLGEIAGAVRAEGLREVFAASAGSKGGQKKGRILYDFMAQGDDEITVAIGDEVIIVDNIKSDEWWIVRKLKNGDEGVVPSSYVEETGFITPVTDPSLKSARSIVEQNRLEEERLSKEALNISKKKGSDVRASEIGPGVKLPKRGSSLTGPNDNQVSSQKSRRDSKSHSRSGSSSKSKPDASKTRTWTDRSGSFKVEAEFIGLKDGKIHLHKLNGVKIAVSVGKMAIEDLEYVEGVTGTSLDDDKPLSDIRRKSLHAAAKDMIMKSRSSSTPKPGFPTESSKPGEPKAPEYDWFDFFLKSGVSPYQCERYAFNFNRDSMDESVLPDITPTVLRTLGLKEGDILRVTKYLDSKYGRTGAKSKLRNVSFSGEEATSPEDGGAGSTSANGANGGLFSGPGGALRNNTRKGRPAPAVQNDDVVDAETFKQRTSSEKIEKNHPESKLLASVPATIEKKPANSFDDDAWDVKPSREPGISQSPNSAPAATIAIPIQPTGYGQQLQAAQQQQLLANQQKGSPFGDPRQQQQFGTFQPLTSQVTGYQPQPPASLHNQQLSINANLPPALTPQITNANAFGAGTNIPPFADPRQQHQFGNFQLLTSQLTGYQPQPPASLHNQQPESINANLPPALTPQITNANAFGTGNNILPFADPRQQEQFGTFQPLTSQVTGYQPQPPASSQNQQLESINANLPPALTPKITNANAFGTSNNVLPVRPGFGQPPPPIPPSSMQPPAAFLQPQKTGPAPPIRFGVGDAQKLAPQLTGRRANLSRATPQNPFGF